MIKNYRKRLDFEQSILYVGEWDKYYGVEIPNWDIIFKTNIKKAIDVQPCQILLWSGHIAIIDWIHYVNDDYVIVDICQSSSGGPQCNEKVMLTQTNTLVKNKYQLFKIEGGTPKIPVGGYVYIMAREGFSY